MKQINKVKQPEEYSNWRNQMARQPNEDYRNMPSDIRGVLLNHLIKEQGFLCGYTMRRVDFSSSHIEHIKPESICREDEKGSDLDIKNMIACYPKKQKKNENQYSYGAIFKNAWWINDGVEFISPTAHNCQIHFDFNLKGEIISLNKNATTTIDVLKLDHKSLTNDRYVSINEIINGKTGSNPITKGMAERLLKEILVCNNKGQFIEFCVAIKCALVKHIQKLDKLAQKNKFILQRKKK